MHSSKTTERRAEKVRVKRCQANGTKREEELKAGTQARQAENRVKTGRAEDLTCAVGPGGLSRFGDRRGRIRLNGRWGLGGCNAMCRREVELPDQPTPWNFGSRQHGPIDQKSPTCSSPREGEKDGRISKSPPHRPSSPFPPPTASFIEAYSRRYRLYRLHPPDSSASS